jgi:hypothetical protein
LLFRARIIEDDAPSETPTIDLEDLKRQLLSECEEMIREALTRQSER